MMPYFPGSPVKLQCRKARKNDSQHKKDIRTRKQYKYIGIPMYIYIYTYTTTLRVIRRLGGRGGEGVVRSCDRSIERSGNGAATDRQRIGLFSLNVPAAIQ